MWAAYTQLWITWWWWRRRHRGVEPVAFRAMPYKPSHLELFLQFQGSSGPFLNTIFLLTSKFVPFCVIFIESFCCQTNIQQKQSWALYIIYFEQFTGLARIKVGTPACYKAKCQFLPLHWMNSKQSSSLSLKNGQLPVQALQKCVHLPRKKTTLE